MIIYSVTVSVDNSIREEWLQWMLDIHIPDVMGTGFFRAYTLQELLDPQPDDDSSTYNIQYLCSSYERYQSYLDTAAPALQADHSRKFKGRFNAFRTVLRRLSES